MIRRRGLVALIGAAAVASGMAWLSNPPAHALAAASPPHVMLVVEENQEFDSIIHSASAPYINSLSDNYATATNWYAVQHNSPTDYLELISGSNQGLPTVPPPYPAPTLVDELHTNRIPWQAYMESMPSNCATAPTADGLYDTNHNPFRDFTKYGTGPSEWCSSDTLNTQGIVPYPGADGLTSALNGSNAPDFVWITPNDCNNMHGDTNTGSTCGSSGNDQLISAGDTWLSTNIAPVLSSAWFAQNGILIITWDEGTTAQGCCGLATPGGHIATIVVTSTNANFGRFTGTGDHYGTLRAIEQAYSVSLLGSSADPANGDLTPAFGPTLGAIGGTVTDSSTLAPLAGAAVSYSGGTATTNGSGQYTLPGVPPGAYSVQAAQAGYVTNSQSVTVTAGSTSTGDFALDPQPPPPPPPPAFAPQGVGAPQVAVTPDGSTQLVFWKSTTTSQLTEAWYTGTWNGPVGFPQLGTLTSTPAVAVTKDGSTQLVFWEGPGGHLFEAWYALAAWHGPVDITTIYLGGHAILASAPSVVTTTDGSQLVFWRGTDGHLAEAWYSNGWHGPVDFATLGSMASAPSATVTADGSTQLVFFQGSDGRLTEDWFTGTWHGPMEFGAVSSPPSVAVTPDGSTQIVFSKTAASHLQESWYAAGSWHGPVDWTVNAFAGTGLLTSSPSATVTVDGSTQIVFWQGAGSTLWEGWYAGGAWHGPVDWSAG